MTMKEKIKEAVELIKSSTHTTVFTGAGISVESGIPPFRGKDGLWSKYDPMVLDINYFYMHPEKSWKVIREIFYEYFEKAKPNFAHYAIAKLGGMNLVQAVITQNIDGLHTEAGSKTVYEFHGTSKTLMCIECQEKYEVENLDLSNIPPCCTRCGGILKPDFIFFGEAIPEPAGTLSFEEAEKADVFILVGTSGKIVPASYIPFRAKENGAKIIEINKEESKYTLEHLSDLFLKENAVEIFKMIMQELN